MAFKLQPADEAFFRTAPERYSQTFAVRRPAEQVWAELVSDKPLDWCRLLSIRWTSQRPFGVGTTREAKVAGASKVQELYFIWEEGHRKAFYATEASAPVFRRLAEDYVVAPDGPDRCLFTWTAAIEPTPLGRFGKPLNGLIFNNLFSDTRRHFQAT